MGENCWLGKVVGLRQGNKCPGFLFENTRELASTRYNFKGPENPGTIPKKVQYQDKEYTLIEETHCAICDNPQCQEMFQYQDDRETGLSMMFYPMLPVYTHNREKELCALCIGL